MIKVIETQYKGYRFRSRLEARWAVFFDALGLEWVYESEGFDLGEAGYYLPDFWLPQVNMFAEVKPNSFSENEINRIKALAEASGFSVLMLEGTPDNKPYFAYEPDGFLMDHCLTMFHGYPRDEGRFYACPGSEEDGRFDDTQEAAIKARSARFEHGEKP